MTVLGAQTHSLRADGILAAQRATDRARGRRGCGRAFGCELWTRGWQRGGCTSRRPSSSLSPPPASATSRWTTDPCERCDCLTRYLCTRALSEACFAARKSGETQHERSGGAQGLTEDQLETVVSKKPQAALMILRGKLAGRHARLLRKERDNAVVELTESRDVATVSLDDVADYSGAMEGEDF